MKKNKLLKLFSFVSAGIGLSFISAIFYPILSYNLTSSRFTSFISPVPEASFNSTDASLWFTGANALQKDSSSVRFYTLSIPKLNIRDATVSLGGEDLSEFLIQYPGTAVPGKNGNAVIFGHSVLPQFFNPRDYLTIFSTLPSMAKGDLVQVDYDGVTYQYKVSEMVEVMPTDLDVLRQDVGGPFISLITCVPPGDPRRPRRLVVRAALVPPSGKLSSL